MQRSFVFKQCGDFTGDDMAALDNQVSVQRRLSHMCQLHSAVMQPSRTTVARQGSNPLAACAAQPYMLPCSTSHSQAAEPKTLGPWSAAEVQQHVDCHIWAVRSII